MWSRSRGGLQWSTPGYIITVVVTMDHIGSRSTAVSFNTDLATTALLHDGIATSAWLWAGWRWAHRSWQDLEEKETKDQLWENRSTPIPKIYPDIIKCQLQYTHPSTTSRPEETCEVNSLRYI